METKRQLVVNDDDDVEKKPCEDGFPTNRSKVGEFKYEEVLHAFALNSLLQNRAGRPLSRSEQVVLIADSGLTMISPPIENSIILGTISQKNYSYKDDKHSDHGTQVATVALGGLDFTIANTYLLRHQTHLKMMNIMKRGGSALNPTYDVDELNLQTALRSAEQEAFIVNLSVRFPTKIEFIEQSKRSRRTLIVVAAGNSGDDLRGTEAWPAKSGGSENDTVITVAALEQSGKRAPFSNWSPEHVDIGALGCFVRTWKLDTKRYVAERVS